jgi:hypothetical protein
MEASGPAALLERWHDFYILIGTAAATLIGLMFVSASVGGSYMTEDRRPGIRAFFSPTIAHFSATLVTCLIVAAPLPGNASHGALLLGCGCVGLGYTGWVWRHMGRRGFWRNIDAEDRMWYARAPFACHGLVVVAALLLLTGLPGGAYVLAPALVLLLLVGIRNAWDITLWVVMRNSK